MQVIGLDPSYTCFAAVSLHQTVGGEFFCAESEQWVTTPKKFPCRLARIEHLRAMVSAWVVHRHPDMVLIEGYAFGAKNGREFAGELGGTIRLDLWKRGYPIFEVPPTTLKHFVTGKGNAEKAMMNREVFRKWHYEAVDDNDADAYALARLGTVLWEDSVEDNATKAMRAILAKVTKI